MTSQTARKYHFWLINCKNIQSYKNSRNLKNLRLHIFKFQADVPNSENKNAQHGPRDKLRGLFGHSTRGRQEIQIRVP